MKNSIIYINQASADEILSDLKNAPNTFYVEIDGRKCKVSLDYLTEMSVKFQFPSIVIHEDPAAKRHIHFDDVVIPVCMGIRKGQLPRMLRLIP